ncbi:MAG: tyrosine-type recombinase/integrase [Imperialibacter sp.]
MFLFQVYTGLYYSDLKNLTRDAIRRNEQGSYIVGDRIKNNNAYMIPVYKFENAEKILSRYYDEKSYIVFPDTISDQKYNEKLKDIASKAKISKNITNKVAKHTNAQLYIASGAGRQFVSKLLGHSDEETTQEYYDISIHDIDARLKTIEFNKLGI